MASIILLNTRLSLNLIFWRERERERDSGLFKPLTVRYVRNIFMNDQLSFYTAVLDQTSIIEK